MKSHADGFHVAKGRAIRIWSIGVREGEERGNWIIALRLTLEGFRARAGRFARSYFLSRLRLLVLGLLLGSMLSL
jgi:hypothetical protein